MGGYKNFSYYYDRLIYDVNYQKNANYYDEIISKFSKGKGILLDLACGTGSLSFEMAKRGYDVIGVDLSQDMLGIAIEKKYENSLPVQFICQDMTKLDLYGTIDVTLCTLDSLNHLKDKHNLEKAIKKVSLFTEKNGLFIFDMNTPYKHKKILTNNTFTYETADVFCVWENEFLVSDDNKIDISLTFFEKNGDVYKRYDEYFSEIAFENDIIIEILVNSGFEIITCFDGFTWDSPTEKSERITYVARKVK